LGSAEITEAIIDLLEEALRIGTTKHQKQQPKGGKQQRHEVETTTAAVDPYSLERYNSANSLKPKSSAVVPISTPTVDRFTFASESCMHVSTLAEHVPPTTAAAYPASEVSWIDARNTPNNGYAKQLQWDVMHTAISPNHIWKADQWIVLTQRHA